MQKKKRLDEAEKQEKIKEELTRNCLFHPIVEIPSDAWDVTFSYSLV